MIVIPSASHVLSGSIGGGRLILGRRLAAFFAGMIFEGELRVGEWGEIRRFRQEIPATHRANQVVSQPRSMVPRSACNQSQLPQPVRTRPGRVIGNRNVIRDGSPPGADDSASPDVNQNRHVHQVPEPEFVKAERISNDGFRLDHAVFEIGNGITRSNGLATVRFPVV